MAAKKKATARRAGRAATPASVTPSTLQAVQFEPLRAEAAAALARGETVRLLTGRADDGGRVETLVFAPSGKGAQSLGSHVHRGDWVSDRLVTDRGHLLDADACCFCRDCEAAQGYTLDDDE